MPAAIRCRDLRKTYDAKPPVEALRGLDLEVGSGECFGLLGPNGAGKTTTVEILEGILEPTSGEVEVLGMRWKTSDRELREKIGVTLQETKFADKLTVEETLRLFGSFYERGLLAEAVMTDVQLLEKRSAWVVNLSGGQRQRLAVACALVGDPDLLFLDEPTTGLDPQSRRQLWDIIRDLRRRGRTILLTTHYMDEAERLCDRVAIVDQGKVIALGSPAELIRSLGGDHVVEFAVESTVPEPFFLDSVNTGSATESTEKGSGAAIAPDNTGPATESRKRGSGTVIPSGTVISSAADRGGSEGDTLAADEGRGPAIPKTAIDGIDLDALRKLPSVRSARTEGDAIQLTVAEPHVAIPALLQHLKQHLGPRVEPHLGRGQRALSQLSTRHASLEDVFVALTGRHLRDA